VQVHIQRKLVAELRRAFWYSQQLSDDVILFRGVQSLDYWVIYFQGLFNTKDSDSHLGSPWINKSCDVCLQLSWKLIRLVHFDSVLQ